MVKIKASIKGIALVLVCLIVFGTGILPAYASGDSIQFTVLPVYPDNQQDSSLGYFDLDVKPNATQTLQVMVSNHSSEEMVVSVGAVSASTTGSGVIDYTTPDIKDETLKHPFSELTKVEEEQVIIPANGEKVINISLKMPSEAFEGIILGGIRVTNITDRLKREQKEVDETKLSMSIYNEYEYIIAVVLHENDNSVSPNYELGDVYLGIDNHRAAIVADIRNTEAHLAKDLVYNASVSPVGSEQKIFSVEGAEVSFAPNSVMSYAFSDELGVGIKPGTYLFTADITEDGKVWEFSREFTVDEKAVEEVNDKAVNQQQEVTAPQNNMLFVSAIIVLAVVILVLIIVLIMKKR